MFSKIWTKKSMSSCSDNVKQLKEAIANADAVVIGAGSGLRLQQVLLIVENGFRNCLEILQKSILFQICMQGGFIPSIHLKNTGHGGAGISFTIVILMLLNLSIKIYLI